MRCLKAADLGAFLTGGLTESEHREMASHLLSCPTCDPELVSLVPVVALLESVRTEYGATDRAPVQLRERVIAELSVAVRSTDGKSAEQTIPHGGARQPLRRRVVAVAAALLLVAASGAVLAQRGSKPSNKITVPLEALEKDPLNATVRIATDNDTTVAEISVTGTIPGEIYFAWFEDPAGKRIGLGSFRGAKGTVKFRGQTGIARAELAAIGASTRKGDKATDRMRAELKK